VRARVRSALAPGVAASPRGRAEAGARAVVDATRLVLSDRALARAALPPTVLTAAACVLAAWFRAAGERPDGETALHAFVIAFVAVSSMPPTLLQGMWLGVAREARRAQGGEPTPTPPRAHGRLRSLADEGLKALRQAALVTAGLAPVLALVLLTPLGHATTAAAALLWAGYWIVVDAFELPMDLAPPPAEAPGTTWFEEGLRRLATATLALPRALRVAAAPVRWALTLGAIWGGWLARPWRREVAFTARHPWEALGFGLAALLLLVLPGLGLLFRAVVTTAATGLVVRPPRD
jgi:hypothetical protein